MSTRRAARDVLNTLLAALDDVRSFWEAVAADADEPKRAATTARALLDSTKSDVDTLVAAAVELGDRHVDEAARVVRTRVEHLLVTDDVASLFNEPFFEARTAERERLAELARKTIVDRHGAIGDDDDDDDDDDESDDADNEEDLLLDDLVATEPEVEREANEVGTNDDDTYAIDDATFAAVRARLEANKRQRT